MGDTEAAIKEMYSYLGSTPTLLDPQTAKFENQNECLLELAERWRGIPLKGPAQDALIQDFKDAHILDKSRHPITTLRGCTSAFESVGVTVSARQATAKDLEQWPQYLTKAREKFRIIL